VMFGKKNNTAQHNYMLNEDMSMRSKRPRYMATRIN